MPDEWTVVEVDPYLTTAMLTGAVVLARYTVSEAIATDLKSLVMDGDARISTNSRVKTIDRSI